jgi:hypothetical protein
MATCINVATNVAASWETGFTDFSTITGTGAGVLATSPTLVTPTLGAASATSIATALGAVGTPAYTFTGDLNTGMWSPAADTIAFSEGGSEVIRITSTGGFSVGTTSDPGAGAIYATGNITAFFSDKRLKNVVGPITNALEKINKLSGVYYTNNEVANKYGYTSTDTQVGVLAQEVESVLPEIVKAAPFDLDENNQSKSGENYKTVQYEKLIPLLIEAIKDQQKNIDNQEQKINQILSKSEG